MRRCLFANGLRTVSFDEWAQCLVGRQPIEISLVTNLKKKFQNPWPSQQGRKMKREDNDWKGDLSVPIESDVPSVIEASDASSSFGDSGSFLLGVEMAAAFDACVEQKVAAAAPRQSSQSRNEIKIKKRHQQKLLRRCQQNRYKETLAAEGEKSTVARKTVTSIHETEYDEMEEEKRPDNEIEDRKPSHKSKTAVNLKNEDGGTHRFHGRKRGIEVDNRESVDIKVMTEEMKKLRVTNVLPRQLPVQKGSGRSLDSSDGEEIIVKRCAASKNRPMPLALNVDGEFHLFGQIQDNSLAGNCEQLYLLLKLEPTTTASTGSDSCNEDETTVDQGAISRFLRNHPETCAVKYNFGGFTGTICPLSMLCALGVSLELVMLAYEACPDAVLESDLWVGSPLHYACSHRPSPSDVLEYLIDKAPETVRSVNQFGRTPLHMACLFQKDQLDMVQVLLEEYPKAGKKMDKDKNTPIHLALDNKASERVLLHLIRACPKAAKKANSSLMYPLHRACWNEAPLSIVKLLMDSYPKALTAVDDHGQTPLHLACEVPASPAIVRLLVSQCPLALEITSKKGETPLKTAMRQKVTSELLEALRQGQS